MISMPLIETIYSAIIFLISIAIFLRARQLYALTGHRGIKAFRDAFLFWGLSFAIRYILLLIPQDRYVSAFLTVAFNYSLSMAGFSLAYSLVWKSLETKEHFLHMTALAVAIADISLTSYAMFVTQILVLLYAATVSYQHYMSKGLGQLHFISLVLALIGYLSNFLMQFLVPLFPAAAYYTYAITLGVFVIFLCNVFMITKWPKKENA